MVAESIADGGVGEEQGTASGEEKSPRANAAIVDILSRRFGIARTDVEDIFLGQSMEAAHSLCKWVAEKTDAKSPLERGSVLRRAAKNNAIGKYKDGHGSEGPSGGPTKTPESSSEARTKYSPEQIEKNLQKMGA